MTRSPDRTVQRGLGFFRKPEELTKIAEPIGARLLSNGNISSDRDAAGNRNALAV